MKEHAVIDQNAIRRRAHERWLQRGCPMGTADGDWLAAEQELLGEQNTQPSLAVAVALPSPVPTATPSVPRPRRPRSLVTRTSTAPAAQLLAALVANGRR